MIGSFPVLLVVNLNPVALAHVPVLLIEYLTIVGLIVLVFNTDAVLPIYSARQIADPTRRPSEFAVQRVAWVRVAASDDPALFEVVQLLL